MVDAISERKNAFLTVLFLYRKLVSAIAIMIRKAHSGAACHLCSSRTVKMHVPMQSVNNSKRKMTVDKLPGVLIFFNAELSTTLAARYLINASGAFQR